MHLKLNGRDFCRTREACKLAGTNRQTFLRWVKQGKFKGGENILFLHTGGSVALFAYKAPIKAYLQGKELPWTVPDWSPRAS